MNKMYIHFHEIDDSNLNKNNLRQNSEKNKIRRGLTLALFPDILHVFN